MLLYLDVSKIKNAYLRAYSILIFKLTVTSQQHKNSPLGNIFMSATVKSVQKVNSF